MSEPQQQDPPASALFAIRYSYDWLRTWRYVVVQPSVKHVGLAAATFSNKRGLQVFPGVKRLMAITGHSKPSVIDALATMRYLGFLWRRSCGQGSESGHADEYQLCLPRSQEHLPMVDAKSGKEPTLHSLPPIAQQTAVRLGVAARLAKRGGQMSQPGWSNEITTLVGSVNHWWLSQLTPPTHLTYGSTNTDHHHSDRHDRPDAGASGRKYDFNDEDDCYDYVCDHVGDIDPMESSTVDGMLSGGVHPKAIVNTILARRETDAA
ncbi:hypothetical protein [Nonomuraea guangzhouensis]|uniref:Helix-turn-helix domain-containing protein n=1 Tax=Nonomuraea guangzhouensis TaxID=1291555 RepID=A0ABW4GW51_9ACTN|nr:hypothetical protein [Nonomuraea guangzhouensis]